VLTIRTTAIVDPDSQRSHGDARPERRTGTSGHPPTAPVGFRGRQRRCCQRGKPMTMIETDRQTDPRTWAIVVWGLYIAFFFTFAVTMVVGVIIAYVKREELAGTPFESHMTSAIRTFWISLVVGAIGVVLSIIGIGIAVLVLLAVWQLFRIIRGIVRAIDRQPITDPT